MSQWPEFIATEKRQDYLKSTLETVAKKRDQGCVIFPPDKDVFQAFEATPFDMVKVVILGQDPYHGPGQAHGLCFSVRKGIKTPPSLVNIYKELQRDIKDFETPDHGYLLPWAEQGVLMLNTVFTVEQGQAHSHKNLGWETFTDKVIAELNQKSKGIIFLLWGAHAQKKGKQLDTQRHFVLKAPHPSPLSAHRGFIGCEHFSQTNRLLKQQGKTPIDWRLESTQVGLIK